ncbi:MAG: pantoate--beta-alanine ligase [Deltaproteobacteria bacterium]|nr:MAG: pantoate--beta-alanine ligase [Deltaproteobacteria bacterium]
MKIISSIREMQVFSESARNSGQKISFVPTMGYFHDGHLSLMREGRQRADCLAISIYVNPTQFGPSEDFEKYPRDFERDKGLASDVGVDVIFYPEDKEMYPEHYQTYVNVDNVTQNLCGMSRPGHFRGVTTVCAKLFNIVKPHSAIFGKKDFQQLVAIKRMVLDLNMDIDIIGMPIVREPDGLAMSSRNVYLKTDEREGALSLSRSLNIAKEMYDRGERDVAAILAQVRKYIERHPHTNIDYAKICDTTTLKDIGHIEGESVLALAVKINKTRLLDNYVFGNRLDV